MSNPGVEQMPKASNVIVGALAGTGKTTTMAETFRRAAGMKSKIVGTEEQEAIWKATKCDNAKNRGMLAFNTSIKEEWKAMGIPDLEVNTTFGFGLKVLKMNGVLGKMEPNKTEMMLHNINPRLTNKKVFPIVKLTELARLTLTENDYEQLSYLASEHCLTIDEQGVDYVQDLIEKHADNLDLIDYADMVWLPHILGKRIRPFDFLGIDECQDLNKAQHELIVNHANRVMFVGDERQAIYQFAGADAQSYANLKAWLETRPLGMLELPLTVSRRCSKAATALAQQIVPQFRCLPNAKDGSVAEFSEESWFFDKLPNLTPNDMVIARKNAPIVGATLRLLRLKKPARMLGRQFGTDVSFHLKKLAGGSNDSAVVRGKVIADLEEMKLKWSGMKFVSERMKESYSDIATSAAVFCELCPTLTEVFRTIDMMFVEVKDNPKNVILLSSVHRAKGLEADHIHFLEHDITGVPRTDKGRTVEPKPEEINLRYIALTRTRDALTLVRAEPKGSDAD